MFFRLHEYCRLIAGKTRGAIYNLQSGKVHSISPEALKLLTYCATSKEEFLIPPTTRSEEQTLLFLNKLTTLGLGSFYYQFPQPPNVAPAIPRTIALDFLWLELTGTCNNRCLHCYAGSSPEEKDVNVPYAYWLTILKEASEAGARSVQLIGGEPLLYPRWRDLVLYAEELHYDSIEIFTNATLITPDDIRFFKEHHLQLATTIYASTASVHDRVTQNPGSFTLTLDAIKKMLAANIPVRIASIIMKANEQESENIMRLCQSLGVDASPPDMIRPTGRGDNNALKPDTYKPPAVEPPFFTDPASFEQNQSQHSCFSGKLAVTSTGDVIPCIFARNQICGNILTQSLTEIINNEKLQACWHLTKDKIEKCQTCEYRYACHDCRPLAQNTSAAKNWLATPSACSYNPATGIWEGK